MQLTLVNAMPRFSLLIISSFFLIGGVAHFAAADFFIQIMPDYLGWHRELVYISGICEIIGALALLIPRTRLIAAYGLIALCIAVFPANINMALNPEKYSDIPILLLYLRLPLQGLFIWFIWWAVTPERACLQ